AVTHDSEHACIPASSHAQPRAHRQRVAVEEIERAHAALPLTLELAYLDGPLAAGDDDPLAGLDDGAGRAAVAVLVHDGRAVELDLAPVRERGPGGGVGREGADVVVDAAGGLPPVDRHVLLEPLGRGAGEGVV